MGTALWPDDDSQGLGGQPDDRRQRSLGMATVPLSLEGTRTREDPLQDRRGSLERAGGQAPREGSQARAGSCRDNPAGWQRGLEARQRQAGCAVGDAGILGAQSQEQRAAGLAEYSLSARACGLVLHKHVRLGPHMWTSHKPPHHAPGLQPSGPSLSRGDLEARTPVQPHAVRTTLASVRASRGGAQGQTPRA